MNTPNPYTTPSGWTIEEKLAEPTPQDRLAAALLDLVVPKLDITAESVASHLVDAVCETLDTESIENRIASSIDADDIAQHVDVYAIAQEIEIDAEEIAGYVNVTTRDVARALLSDSDCRYDLAQEIDLDELVEKLDLAEISSRVLTALQAPALDGSDLIDDLADLDAEHTSLLDLEERIVQLEARIESLTSALRTSAAVITRAIESLS